jgi:hypothetical protein
MYMYNDISHQHKYSLWLSGDHEVNILFSSVSKLEVITILLQTGWVFDLSEVICIKPVDIIRYIPPYIFRTW